MELRTRNQLQLLSNNITKQKFNDAFTSTESALGLEMLEMLTRLATFML